MHIINVAIKNGTVQKTFSQEAEVVVPLLATIADANCKIDCIGVTQSTPFLNLGTESNTRCGHYLPASKKKREKKKKKSQQ